MTTTAISTINLCPINFGAFEKVNNITNDIEASLLYAQLKFYYINSRIQKFGEKWTTYSREEIAKWFGFSLQKVDSLISKLVDKNLIKKMHSMWFGKKQIFFNIETDLTFSNIDFKLLNILKEQTGSIRSALVFAKIAYAFANTKIVHSDKKYCTLTKEQLSSFSGLSIRTIDTIIENLIKKGFIIKRKFSRKGRVQTHYNIPDVALQTLLKFIKTTEETEPANQEVINNQNCRSQQAKNTISIRIKTNTKHLNNITISETCNTKIQSDINFDKINNDLSYRQLKYLESALNKTITCKKLNISSPLQLWEELKFSILHAEQHKQITSFKHVVSRCMKILGSKNWKTPIGFYTQSEQGRAIKQLLKTQIKHHEILKQEEINNAKKYEANLLNAFNAHNSIRISDLTNQAAQLITKLKNTCKSGSRQLIEYLNNQVVKLVQQGADKQIVSDLLRAC